MTPKEKIDYMIQSLQLAKEEIEYAEEEIKEIEKDDKYYYYGHKGHNRRTPNGTIIRESLKQVGRMANIVANDIVLSSYCDRLFR